MRVCLKIVKNMKPRYGIFENVIGMLHSDADGALSPAEYVRSELRSMGYVSNIIETCLSSWHCATRQRTS